MKIEREKEKIKKNFEIDREKRRNLNKRFDNIFEEIVNIKDIVRTNKMENKYTNRGIKRLETATINFKKRLYAGGFATESDYMELNNKLRKKYKKGGANESDYMELNRLLRRKYKQDF